MATAGLDSRAIDRRRFRGRRDEYMADDAPASAPGNETAACARRPERPPEPGEPLERSSGADEAGSRARVDGARHDFPIGHVAAPLPNGVATNRDRRYRPSRA